MLEPLIWMFKAENFKKHFFYLLIICIVYVLLALGFLVLTAIFGSNVDFVTSLSLKLVNLAILLIPILCLTGYFWSLTDNIINRENDITANNIYNGKLKVLNIIELPEFNFLRFVWRGIASIVATILLCLPVIMFYGSLTINLPDVSDFYGWTPLQLSIFTSIITLLIAIFIPALLWNYARRDSIVAVWNLPKAIYIIGNYSGTYFKNTFLFVASSYLNSYLIKIFTNLIGLNFTTSAASNGGILLSISGSDIILPLILTILVFYVSGIYWIYVNAYILGTIAPPNEY